MPRISVALSLMCLLFTSTSFASGLINSKYRIARNARLRVGISLPEGEPVADVLYLHGFADRIDNHGPLFKSLNDAGMRVIAFDYPSHGNTSAPSIGWYSFEDLAGLVKAVERRTAEKPSRPLIIMGWSTGGLLATRMAQTGQMKNLTRYPSALILVAPGVSVYMLPGDWGTVTEETLTSNPDVKHVGRTRPTSPFQKPYFAMRLFFNSIYSRSGEMPVDLPVLTFVGGNDADVYAKSPRVRRWVLDQRQFNPGMYGIQCADSKHEMDNEIDPIGSTVRKAAADFALTILNLDPSSNFGTYSLSNASGCASF